MRTADVIVIGAGPAGLAASYELARAGMDHAVLERGDTVGYSWTRLYDSLVLHTGKHLSALPGLSYPRGTPLFPTRTDFLDYLQRYAETFRLPIEMNTDVVLAERQADRWIVRSADGTTREARAIVIATGVASNPYIPDLPGRAEFRGQMLHSHDYHRPGDVRGPRVLVVGTGNSAGEIAAELASAGVSVDLSVRSGATIVPRDVLGVPIQYIGVLLRPLPLGAQRSITAAFGALMRLGKGVAPVLPPQSPAACTKVPLIGLRLAEAIRAGTVRVRSGLAGFSEHEARFVDGTTGTFDTILLATGYRAALGPIAHLVKTDVCGFALRRDQVISTDQPDLFFVGQNYGVSGAIFNMGRDARRAASAIRKSLAR